MIRFRFWLREDNYICDFLSKSQNCPHFWTLPQGLAGVVVQSHKLLSCMHGIPLKVVPVSSTTKMVGSSTLWLNCSWKGVAGSKGKRQTIKGLSCWKGIGSWGIRTTIPMRHWKSVSTIKLIVFIWKFLLFFPFPFLYFLRGKEEIIFWQALIVSHLILACEQIWVKRAKCRHSAITVLCSFNSQSCFTCSNMSYTICVWNW